MKSFSKRGRGFNERNPGLKESNENKFVRLPHIRY